MACENQALEYVLPALDPTIGRPIVFLNAVMQDFVFRVFVLEVDCVPNSKLFLDLHCRYLALYNWTFHSAVTLTANGQLFKTRLS